jgi:tetratricopeptide (TPR) repeat protein
MSMRQLGTVAVAAILCACSEPASLSEAETSRSIKTGSPLEPARQKIVDFWRVYNHATLFRVGGDVATALVYYDSALALNPDHGDALYNSAGVAFQLGDFPEAERRWRRLLAVDDSNARAHVQLGALYSCGLPGAPMNLPRARQELERALTLNRAVTGPQVRLGEIALLQGDTDAAEAHLTAARQTNERSVTAHYLLGYLYWQAGRIEAAGEALHQATVAGRGGHVDASASAEGQTKRGYRPLLETVQDGPLALHWQTHLEALTSVTAATTHVEYERFHRATSSLRERFR